MRKLDVIELITTVIFGLSMVSIGFFVGQRHPIPQYRVNHLSLFEINKDQVWLEMTNAITTLANCPAFRKGYPERFRAFIRYMNGKQAIGYDSSLNFDYYAYTDGLTKVIWLGPVYFSQPSEERSRTIAHEILHVIGFPNHVTDKNGEPNLKIDQIYNLTDACFKDLPKEVP